MVFRMVISILFVDTIVSASSASTIFVGRKRDNRHVCLALEGSRFHEMKSADALANYPKVPSEHSLVACESFPSFFSRVEFSSPVEATPSP
jgi:hypothetical protein